jgi:hypothetical protein
VQGRADFHIRVVDDRGNGGGNDRMKEGEGVDSQGGDKD